MSLRTMKIRTFRANMLMSGKLINARESLPMITNVNLKTVEAHAIRQALDRNNGNRERTARQLGIGERTLYRKIKEYSM